MAQQHQDDERTHLLPTSFDRRRSRLLSVAAEVDGASIASSHVSKEELALGETAVGERLPYNDYTTIDWLHDLVRIPLSSTLTPLKFLSRSKTPSVTEPFARSPDYDIGYSFCGTVLKDG